MSNTYSAVDQSTDVDEALDWQDRIDEWPQIRAYKERSYELIAGLAPVLDVGAGTGNDLLALGGTAIGVDLSAAMCGRASQRGGVVCRADALQLPFSADCFGATRADRVIQHVTDPAEAVGELVRITRRGGRIVICDPDQESLVIAVPGVRRELVDSVKRARRDRGYRNGTLAARLPAVLSELGLEDITVDAFPLVLRDPDDAFGLPGWVRYFGQAHPHDQVAGAGLTEFKDEDAREWDRGMSRARAEGSLVYALLYFVVSARRP